MTLPKELNGQDPAAIVRAAAADPPSADGPLLFHGGGASSRIRHARRAGGRHDGGPGRPRHRRHRPRPRLVQRGGLCRIRPACPLCRRSRDDRRPPGGIVRHRARVRSGAWPGWAALLELPWAARHGAAASNASNQPGRIVCPVHPRRRRATERSLTSRPRSQKWQLQPTRKSRN